MYSQAKDKVTWPEANLMAKDKSPRPRTNSHGLYTGFQCIPGEGDESASRDAGSSLEGQEGTFEAGDTKVHFVSCS